MKNQLFSLIAIATIVGIAIFVAVSCSKTDSEPVKQEGVITHFSPQENMVEPTIVNFLNRYESYKAGYKSGGEDIALGEAIWTLEAGVNYLFQSPKEDLSNFSSEETTFIVDVYVGNDNKYFINEEDAMNLFSEMFAFTNNEVVGEDIDLYVADLEVVFAENEQVELEFEVLAGGQDPTLYCTVTITDYWYAAGDIGKCGEYQGQYLNLDAANRLQVLLNCVQQNVGYWTDVYNTGWVLQYYDNNLNPCFWGMDYTGSHDECLEPADIEYWLGQAEYVIQELKPSGKDYINSRFDDELLLGNGTWFHYFDNIRYGIPHSGGIE